MPKRSVMKPRAVSEGSATRTTSNLSLRCSRPGTCSICPINPAPSTPVRNRIVPSSIVVAACLPARMRPPCPRAMPWYTLAIARQEIHPPTGPKQSGLSTSSPRLLPTIHEAFLEEDLDHEREAGHQSDRLDQRLHALARRFHPARDLPR